MVSVPIYTKQWIREAWAGWRKKQTMTKEKAEEILRRYRASVEKNAEKAEFETAKHAANKFERSPGDVTALIQATQKLLNDSQAKDEDKYPDLQLNNTLLGEALALKNDGALAKAIAAYKTKAKDASVDRTQLDNLKKPLIDAIDQQHALDIAAITDLFANEMFTKEQKTPSAETVKTQMLAALENSKTEKLADLNKDLQPDSIRSLEYYQRAEARILFLTTIADKTRHQAFFDKLDANNATAESGSGISISNHNESARYANADLSKLENIYTSSGKHVQISANGFAIQSGILQFGITEKDALQLALLVRERGDKSIVFTLDHSDPKLLIKMEKDAARAALKAGFDSEKITIKTKNHEGKEVTKTVKDILGSEVVKSLLSTSGNENQTTHYKTKLAEGKPPSQPTTQETVKPSANPTSTTGGS